MIRTIKHLIYKFLILKHDRAENPLEAKKPVEDTSQHINKDGLAIVKQYEGLKLEAYICPAGKWTIGWGHTKYAAKGMRINLEQAEDFLNEDLRGAADAVRMLPKVSLSSNQFSALVSFVFNVGVGAFKRSTMLRLLNEGDYLGAAQQFDRWVYATNPKTGKKETLKGLVARRFAEKQLFMA